MCEPTPISTFYSISTTTEWSTTTSSWSVLSTPDIQTQTITETACAATSVPSSSSPSPTPSTANTPSTPSSEWSSQTSSYYPYIKDDGDADDQDAQLKVRLKPSTTFDNALAVKPTTTTATSVVSLDKNPTLTTTTTKQEQTSSSTQRLHIKTASIESHWSSKAKAALALAKRQDGECLSWSTNIIYSTSVLPVETIWSSTVITTLSESQVNVPVSTLYAQCEPSLSSTQSTTSTSPSPSPSIWSSSATLSSIMLTSAVTSRATQPTSASTSSSTIQAQRFADSTVHSSSSSPNPTSTTTTDPSPTTSSAQITLIEANQPTQITTHQILSTSKSLTQTRSSGTVDPATATASSAGTSKGEEAGAVVGSLAALALLITGSLVLLHWWRKRKRAERTRLLRSSWFYGGDVAEPGIDDNDESAGRSRVYMYNEKRASSPPNQSRFSAPSLISRSSLRQSHLANTHPSTNPSPVLALPAFFSHPISHIRNTSGRFPTVLADIRRSVIPNRNKATPAWAEKYTTNVTDSDNSSNSHGHIPSWERGEMEEILPPLLPRQQSVREALKHDRISPPLGTWDRAPPQLDMPETNPSLNLEWQTDIDGSPRVIARYLTGSSDKSASSSLNARHSHSNREPVAHNQGQTRGLGPVYRGDPGPSLQSYYSVYSTPDTIYTNPRRSTIGQALSPPGDDSIEISQFPIPPGMSFSFLKPSPSQPMPAELWYDNERQTHLPAAQRHIPHAGLETLATAEDGGMTASSLFEFASYAGARDSSMTTRTGTSRVTRNWYDKPLWDGQDPPPQHPLARESKMSEQSGVWTTGGNVPDQARKSRSKSVRWDDEQTPKVHELAQAL